MEDQFWAIVARKKAGGNPEWQWSSCEAIGPDFLVKGGVPRLLTRGKRKGEPTWKGRPLDTFVVSRVECDSAEQDYVASTGNCPRCRGKKTELARWSKDDGAEYRDCRKCSGSGRAAA